MAVRESREVLLRHFYGFGNHVIINTYEAQFIVFRLKALQSAISGAFHAPRHYRALPARRRVATLHAAL